MRVRNLISFGMAAAVAAACSNPSSDVANDSAAGLLSELEPALLTPAAAGESVVLSASELAPSEAGETKSVAAPPPSAPARIDETARVDAVEPEMVHVAAHVHGADAPVGAVAVAGDVGTGTGHGEDSPEVPSTGRGILIRGGVDTGIFGDPCIPGGHRPGQGGIAGSTGIIGDIADASAVGSMGVMINDQSPRIGRGDLPYPRNTRGRSTPAGGMGGMGGGGRVFIR